MYPDILIGFANSTVLRAKSRVFRADAILHGVPVFAEAGPGSVYYKSPLGYVDFAKPLSLPTRKAALADIAYWQWTQEEIERGDLWKHLRNEGVV